MSEESKPRTLEESIRRQFEAAGVGARLDEELKAQGVRPMRDHALGVVTPVEKKETKKASSLSDYSDEKLEALVDAVFTEQERRKDA